MDALPSLRYETCTLLPIHASYPENPTTIGEHIRKRRMDLGLYQSEVGRQFKVSKDCVTNWENGRNEPMISYYPRIIDFLGYNPFIQDGKSTLGKQMTAYRIANGLGTKGFAKLIGISQYAVLAVEANRCVPRRKTLLKILEVINGS